MAFKTIKSYNEEKFGGLFRLLNDGDYADVIFLYRDADDVLVADTHYIKSADYSGYVHCCEKGCPACAKNIRVQTKLFIPLYNINDKEIQFWDRTTRFEPQLNQDVFKKFPNPCEFVFRITRHGVPNDVNTTYSIQAIGKNTLMSYTEILTANNAKMPDYYEHVCRQYTPAELSGLLTTSESTSSGAASTGSGMPDYQIKPRTTTTAAVEEPQTFIPEVAADTPPFDTADSDESDFEELTEDPVF